MRPIEEIVPPVLTVVNEKAAPRFGNPEKRAQRAAERTRPRSGKRPKPRSARPPHISANFREVVFYRARWERVNGWPHRSRRFSTRRSAFRFYNLLFEE